MSDSKKVDDLLESLSKKQPAPPKQEKPKKQISKKVIASTIAIVSIVILTIAFVVVRNNKIEQEVQQQRKIELKKEKEAKTKAKKAKMIESQYFLSKKEYRDNIETLTNANIGLVKNDEKGLVGYLTFPNGKKSEVLYYSRKTGKIHTVNDKLEPVVYDDKWVGILVAKIKATQNNQQEKNEREKTNESTTENSQD